MEASSGSAAQIEKNEIADSAARKAEKAAKIAERAAQEAEQLAEEERNLAGWFAECVALEPSRCIKQNQWYADYRLWANLAHVTTLTEATAVATFRRLHPEISVGQKTYGIKLLSQEPAPVPVPLVSKWLIDLIRSETAIYKLSKQIHFSHCFLRIAMAEHRSYQHHRYFSATSQHKRNIGNGHRCS